MATFVSDIILKRACIKIPFSQTQINMYSSFTLISTNSDTLTESSLTSVLG